MRHYSRDLAFLQFNEMLDYQNHVSINVDKLQTLIEYLKSNKGEFKPYGWFDYVSKEAGSSEKVDLARLLFEMALISGQQGGFIDADANGKAVKWEVDGSGAKAMVNKLKEIRAEMGVPGIDFTYSQAVFEKIAKILGDDIPFKSERLGLLSEFAKAGAYEAFEKKVLATFEDQKNICMDVDFLEDLVSQFPRNFMDDPFLKKACLTFILAAANLKSRGVNAELDIWAASDYRLPQTLETLGILELSAELKADLENQTLLPEDSPKVNGLRVAAILAVGEICMKTGLSVDHADFMLWSAPRNKELMQALSGGAEPRKALPHLMVRTLRF